MVKGKRYLVMMFPAAFLGAKRLTAAVRPEHFATDSTLSLSVVVFSSLGLTLRLFLLLSCLIAALLRTKDLSVTCWDKLFSTMGTDLFHDDFTAVFRTTFSAVSNFSPSWGEVESP